MAETEASLHISVTWTDERPPYRSINHFWIKNELLITQSNTGNRRKLGLSHASFQIIDNPTFDMGGN